MHRFFSELFLGDTAELSADESRHALLTLRLKAGDSVEVMDGKGHLFSGTLFIPRKNEAHVHSLLPLAADDSVPKVSVYMSIPKHPERFEWFLEKATELGVNNISLLTSKRSEKHFFKEDRWRKILIAALKQSGRLFLPNLHAARAFEEAVRQCKGKKLIAHCVHTLTRQSLKDAVNAQDKEVSIFIGPEGDFTPDELNFSLQHGFISVSLGPARLRTETAGVAACALLNHILND